MTRERDAFNMGLSFLGNFNPVIVTPQWLASKSIIRESEADNASIEIIHPDFTRFELDWISIQTSPERIDFRIKRESDASALRDLTVSVFRILKETPVVAFGINHFCHYSLKDMNEYANFGYWFSPVKVFDDVMTNPKLLKIEFIETKKDTSEDILRLTIMPSDLINDRKSVVFNFNHHFNTKNSTTPDIIDILQKNWEASFAKINSVSNSIWEKVKI